MAEHGREDKAPAPAPKRKHKHAAHHGGAWKVAFADFMTSMFALFLVLWIISSTSSEQKEAVAQYFRNPTIFDKGSSSPIDMGKPSAIGESESQGQDDAGKSEERRMQQLDSILSTDEVIQALGGQVEVEMTDRGLKIELSDAGNLGFFEVGSSRINPAVREVLAHVAEALKSLPNRLVVAGYTDRHQYSHSGYTNWQLSADRANEVRNFLISHGTDTSRFAAVVGYGDNELANPKDPYAPENRRVSLLVLKGNSNFSLR